MRLAPLDLEKHLDNAVRWLNDPEVTHNLLIGDVPMTRLMEEEYLRKSALGSDTDITFAIETLGGKHIGFSGIHGINWRHGFASSGTVIGEKEEHGKGYGSDAAKVRARYCFDVLGLRQIYSGYLEGNDRSRGMLTRAGYVECGRKPKRYWKRGRFVDEILMVLDRDRWAVAGGKNLG